MRMDRGGTMRWTNGVHIFGGTAAALLLVIAPVLRAQNPAPQTSSPETLPTAPKHIDPSTPTAHLFRYIIGLPTGDADFRVELPATPTPVGPYYSVEKDPQGRIVRVTGMRGTQITGTTLLEYAGASKFAFQSEDYDLGGNLMEITPMQRDSDGHIVRWEHRNPDGKLGGYTTAEWSNGHMRQHSFDADGKPGGHSEHFYGEKGTMSGAVQYASPVTETEYSVQTVDEENGLITAALQYRDGKLLFSTKYFHGPDGSLSRKETYTTAGFLGIIETFANGELTDRVYHYPSGHSRELRYFYDDANRQLLKTEISYDGGFVCTLAYAYDTPAVVRTTAYGADGTVWAKYPSPGVLDVLADGQAEGRTDATIYKQGKWW